MNDEIKKLFEEAVIGIEEVIDYDMGRSLYQKAYEQGAESQQAKIDNLAEWNKRLKAKMDELEKKYQNDPATIQLLECTDRCIELENQRDELRAVLNSVIINRFCAGVEVAYIFDHACSLLKDTDKLDTSKVDYYKTCLGKNEDNHKKYGSALS